MAQVICKVINRFLCFTWRLRPMNHCLFFIVVIPYLFYLHFVSFNKMSLIASPLVLKVSKLECRVQDHYCYLYDRLICFTIIVFRFVPSQSNRVLDATIVIKFACFSLFFKLLKVTKDMLKNRKQFL